MGRAHSQPVRTPGSGLWNRKLSEPEWVKLVAFVESSSHSAAARAIGVGDTTLSKLVAGFQCTPPVIERVQKWLGVQS